MLHSQQLCQVTDLATFKAMFKTLSPFRNPDLDALFPQPVLPCSEPVPNASATDISSEIGDQPLINEDLDESSQADPNGIVSMNDDSVSSTNIIQKGTAIQSLWCEVCSIDCNSKDVLEKHLSGKKHKKKLQTHDNPNTAIHGVTNKEQNKIKIIQSMRCEVCSIDCNSKVIFEKHLSGKKHKRKIQTLDEPNIVVPEASPVACIEVSETMRSKLLDGGPPVNSMKVCMLCNITCNSQEMFNKHLAGRKHAAQARMRSQIRELSSVNITSVSKPAISLITLPLDNASSACEDAAMDTKIVQFVYCDVCKIYCNCNDILSSHKLGKEHLKNLEKLVGPRKDTYSPGFADKLLPKDLVDVPMGDSEAYKANITDLKRKKTDQPELPEEDVVINQPNIVREAPKDAGKACAICKVFCNSQTVLDSHLAGQKHGAMMKKHAAMVLKNQAGGSQVVDAT